MRPARRWRLLLAHDATAATCNPLIESIEGALGNVDIYESASVHDAHDVLRSSLSEPPFDGSLGGPRFDLAMVCLDLPPVPAGGVRLAQDLVRAGLPVVLITRSLRWIPPSAGALRELPWVPPDAPAVEVARAIGEAMASAGVDGSTWTVARQAGGE